MHRTLTIAGSDSGGGAGIQADIKTITALGGYATSVITAMTAQNTLGVTAIHEVPEDFIRAQLDAVMTDIGTDAVKTGMLASPSVVHAVADKVRQYNIDRLVVDPVMAAKSGDRLLSEQGMRTLVAELLPLAFVVTPNIPEAEIIAGMQIGSGEDMEAAAERIAAMGPPHVVVKGGHRAGDALDVLYTDGECIRFAKDRIETKNTHGTGCTFSAAIAAGLAAGLSVVSAVAQAEAYIETAITFALPIGHGHGPTDHTAWFVRESERYRVISSLMEAARLLAEKNISPLIPEVQSNLGYALPFATDRTHVASFPGRIVRCGNSVIVAAAPAFGASTHIANIILTAVRTHPQLRSAMNVRFSEDLVRRAAERGIATGSFSREDEPAAARQIEGSSLSWGIGKVLSESPAPPDIIWDRGGVGKEPMIRILGTNPMDVAIKALCLL